VEYLVVAAVVAALFYIEKMRGVSGLNQLPSNLGGGAPLNANSAPTAPTATDQGTGAPSPAANPDKGPVISQGAATQQAASSYAAPGTLAPSSPDASNVVGLPPPPSVTLTADQAGPYITPPIIEPRSFDGSVSYGQPSTPHSSFYPSAAFTKE
jgi:hypothetical protein